MSLKYTRSVKLVKMLHSLDENTQKKNRFQENSCQAKRHDSRLGRKLSSFQEKLFEKEEIFPIQKCGKCMILLSSGPMEVHPNQFELNMRVKTILSQKMRAFTIKMPTFSK